MTARTVVRILWGGFFAGSSLVNLFWTLPHPEFYRQFADLTFFGLYRDLLLNVAIPNAKLITWLVVMYEATAGVLVLIGGQLGPVGLWATAGWLIFITPFMGWYTIWAPVLLVIPLWLTRGS